MTDLHVLQPVTTFGLKALILTLCIGFTCGDMLSISIFIVSGKNFYRPPQPDAQATAPPETDCCVNLEHTDINFKGN